MKIAVAGKGGSGKTTLAATLGRLLARKGRPVLAVDGDSNPNLGVCLGLPAAEAASWPTLPRDLLAESTLPDGTRTTRLSMPTAEIAARFGVAAPDGVRLLVMGRVAHAGAG
jgi:CO dehydrogenase maturation factor